MLYPQRGDMHAPAFIPFQPHAAPFNHPARPPNHAPPNVATSSTAASTYSLAENSPLQLPEPTPPKPPTLRFNVRDSSSGDSAARDVALAAWRPDETTIVDVVGSRVSVALTRAANNVQATLRAAADASPFIPRNYRLAFCLLGHSQPSVSTSTTTTTSTTDDCAAAFTKKGVPRAVRYDEHGAVRGGGKGKGKGSGVRGGWGGGNKSSGNNSINSSSTSSSIVTLAIVPKPSAEILKYLHASSGYICLQNDHYMCVFSARSDVNRPFPTMMTASELEVPNICVIKPLLPPQSVYLDEHVAAIGSQLGWEPDLCMSGRMQEMVAHLTMQHLMSVGAGNDSMEHLLPHLRAGVSATSQCMLAKHGQGACVLRHG